MAEGCGKGAKQQAGADPGFHKEGDSYLVLPLTTRWQRVAGRGQNSRQGRIQDFIRRRFALSLAGDHQDVKGCRGGGDEAAGTNETEHAPHKWSLFSIKIREL